MDELTNDAKFLVSAFYKKYIDARTQGKTKHESVLLGHLDSIHSEIMPEWQKDDVRYTIMELDRQGFVVASPASNTIIRVVLTTQAIATLETNFKDKIDTVLDYMAKVKNAIPFI